MLRVPHAKEEACSRLIPMPDGEAWDDWARLLKLLIIFCRSYISLKSFAIQGDLISSFWIFLKYSASTDARGFIFVKRWSRYTRVPKVKGAGGGGSPLCRGRVNTTQ